MFDFDETLAKWVTRMDKPQKPGLMALAASIVSAAMGVQSDKNRERDFAGGNPYRFVVAGILGTLLFVLTMWLIVRAVLRASGA